MNKILAYLFIVLFVVGIVGVVVFEYDMLDKNKPSKHVVVVFDKEVDPTFPFTVDDIVAKSEKEIGVMDSIYAGRIIYMLRDEVIDLRAEAIVGYDGVPSIETFIDNDQPGW